MTVPCRTPKLEVLPSSGRRWQPACRVEGCEDWWPAFQTQREANDIARQHRADHRRAADIAQASLETEQRQRVLAFRVDGLPRAQGSMVGRRRGNKTMVVAYNDDELRSWRSRVAYMAAQAARAQGWEQITWPVRVWAVFTTEGRELDVDKLQRALGDGITDAGLVWNDDKRARAWVADDVRDDGPPGVDVVITHRDAFHPRRPKTVSDAFDSLRTAAGAVA